MPQEAVENNCNRRTYREVVICLFRTGGIYTRQTVIATFYPLFAQTPTRPKENQTGSVMRLEGVSEGIISDAVFLELCTCHNG